MICQKRKMNVNSKTTECVSKPFLPFERIYEFRMDRAKISLSDISTGDWVSFDSVKKKEHVQIKTTFFFLGKSSSYVILFCFYKNLRFML